MVNIASLTMVSDELVSTIEQSASSLEDFVRSPDSAQPLQNCVEMIDQVRGTLRLLELQGAVELAEEIVEALNEFTVGNMDHSDQLLTAITSAFFILPRYLEYVQQAKNALPNLMIPSINEIRTSRQKKPIYEGVFFGPVETDFQPVSVSVDVDAAEKLSLSKRVRHMYQIGLLNTIRDQQVRGALGMMQRATERMAIIAGQQMSAEFWTLAAASIEALRLGDMPLTVPRKLLLSSVDAFLRSVIKSNLEDLSHAADQTILREFYYLLVLSGVSSPKVDAALDRLVTPVLQYTEAELQAELDALKGPSLQTFESMSSVLTDELNKAKQRLEALSEIQMASPEDYSELIELLVRIVDTMKVVGLESAASQLAADVEQIKEWSDQSVLPSSQQLVEVADTFMYIDSAISRLANTAESGFYREHSNDADRREVIAMSQLEEAQMIVFKEMQDGLLAIKRALTAFSESDYEVGHIANAASILRSIKGGFVIMGYDRAAFVVARCIQFVIEDLTQGEPSAAIEQLLETFADAIISLEYYIDALMEDRSADDSVLEVAEESLQAMGHPVSEK